MSFKVIVTRDFNHMSEIAAQIVIKDIKNKLNNNDTYVLGLATGNTPTGLYKRFAKIANAGEFDCSRILSFNHDEYIGLPGENAQPFIPKAIAFSWCKSFLGSLKKNLRKQMCPGAHSLIR